MTPDADLGLGTRIDDGIGAELRGELKFAGRTHDLVAVNALDAPECMATGSPKCLVATLVANQAAALSCFADSAESGRKVVSEGSAGGPRIAWSGFFPSPMAFAISGTYRLPSP